MPTKPEKADCWDITLSRQNTTLSIVLPWFRIAFPFVFSFYVVFYYLWQPLGFQIDDAKLKRAGLDYWPYPA